MIIIWLSILTNLRFVSLTIESAHLIHQQARNKWKDGHWVLWQSVNHTSHELNASLETSIKLQAMAFLLTGPMYPDHKINTIHTSASLDQVNNLNSTALSRSDIQPEIIHHDSVPHPASAPSITEKISGQCLDSGVDFLPVRRIQVKLEQVLLNALPAADTIPIATNYTIRPLYCRERIPPAFFKACCSSCPLFSWESELTP